MTDLPASNSSAESAPNYGNVDATTRARAGSLAAHGLLEQQIADILMLSLEQVLACKNSEEYKNKYAATADEIIQRQIDLADGWDTVEEKALSHMLDTLDTLEFNRDPNYALAAARAANQANRRTPKSQNRVIDSGASGRTNNVIVLQLNKTYINASQQSDSSAIIDITNKVAPASRQIADLPTPKSIDNLLAPVKDQVQARIKTELEEAFEVAGVFKDE